VARMRMVKPEFFKHEGLAELSPLHRLLFQGLWLHADRAGRLEDRPKRLKVEVLPYDDCDVEAMLGDLVRAGFIVRYEVAGHRLIEVPTLAKHQHFNLKEPASTLPGPDGTVPAPSQHRARTVPTRQEQEQEQEQEEPPSRASAPAPLGVGDQVLITLTPESPKTAPAPNVEGSRAAAQPDPDEVVYARWRDLWAPRASPKLDPKRRKLIQARRKERLRETAQADLLRSLEGWRHDPWADRPQHAKLEQLLRDAGQVDKGLELASRAGPNRPAAANAPPADGCAACGGPPWAALRGDFHGGPACQGCHAAFADAYRADHPDDDPWAFSWSEATEAWRAWCARRRAA
jgi:hypothetical protein